MVQENAQEAYDRREAELTPDLMREIERRVVLSVLDRKWREHLYEMDYLREGIGLRAMAQRDPLVEYQREGYDMFNSMMDGIKEESVGNLFNLQFEIQENPIVEEVGAGAQLAFGGSLPGVTAGGAAAGARRRRRRAGGPGPGPAPAAPARHARPVPPAPEPVAPPAAFGKRPGGGQQAGGQQAAGQSRGRHAADGRGHATAAGRGQAATRSSGARADRACPGRRGGDRHGPGEHGPAAGASRPASSRAARATCSTRRRPRAAASRCTAWPPTTPSPTWAATTCAPAAPAASTSAATATPGTPGSPER